MFCAFACMWDDIHYLDVKYGGVMKLVFVSAVYFG